MNESDISIAVVTIPDISNYNPERENYSICSKLTPEFNVTLIGAEYTSERIAEKFDIDTKIKRNYKNRWLRRLLLFPITFYLLFSHVQREQPNVIASFGNLSVNGLVCSAISNLTGSESVVRTTSDFTNLWKYQDNIIGKSLSFVKNNLLGELAIRLADNVIVQGPVMARKLQTKGVDQSKIWTIPQPIHIDLENTERNKDRKKTTIREKLNISDEAHLIIFVGYFDLVKGPKRLARTVQYVMQRSVDTHIIIAGSSGQYEERIKHMLQEYDQVHFTGWVERDRLSEYFQSADVLFHPSNSEGLPNVILEALYYNVPVVATDSGGEVPVYVSNIGNDYQELGEMLLKQCYDTDPCPKKVQDPKNRQLYQNLFETIVAEQE